MKISKKILGSLGIVVVTTALAVGGTISYFSDKETSELNTFTAGAVDLTVDSVGHYNGLICIDKLWQSCELPNEGINLVVNGGFEDPEVTDSAKWQIFSSIPGWDIDWAEDDVLVYGGQARPEPALQEYHEGVNGWLAAEGNQYAELDSDWKGPNDSLNGEPALVKISQEVGTTAGMKYALTWMFSPRPDTVAGENVMYVKINGALVETNGVEGGTNTEWVKYSEYFTATGGSTVIEFIGDGPNNSLGVFLDDVQVNPMTCTPSREYTEACGSTWTLTDLGPEYQFFKFGDIKPGDEGENTISLHVNNNDAYGCMLFTNLVDDEHLNNEPETEAGDTTEPGELSDNIYMFAWADNGNNIWDANEVPFWNGYKKANEVDGEVFTLSSLEKPIVGGDTRYVGLAWCAGTMGFNDVNKVFTCDGVSMGNDTQTDKMMFDVQFYVEQTRHNEGFTCEKLLVKPTVAAE